MDKLETTKNDKASRERANRRKEGWERKILEKVALSATVEQRKARRWGVFFKLFFVTYIVIITVVLFTKNNQNQKNNLDYLANKIDKSTNKKHIALVKLDGIIASGQAANASLLNYTLRSAAMDEHVAGILILANSPGGSPVQSSMVYKAIREIKKDYPNKKIVTSITDVCASGCYYIVSATDEIYADNSSVVGSIGVISQGYGYGETMKKIGVDLRTFKAGKYKDFMDPARPIKTFEKEHLQELLDQLHSNFITDVKTGRGERLKPNQDLFTGLFWTGKKSLELGLIDGIANTKQAATKIGYYPVYDYSPTDPVKEIIEKFGLQVEKSAVQFMDKLSTPRQKIELR